MQENKYDDADFFANYREMPRSVAGLQAAGEWPELRVMLPDLAGKRMLDLGCGYGWHCRYAREQQAHSVIGIDLSEKMLEQARKMTDDPGIHYRRLAIEEMDYAAEQFDVVLSSLALHYIADFTSVCHRVYESLLPGGSFVFSVEHPIFTAYGNQEWIFSPQGDKLHWPVDRYHEEGPRQATFLGHVMTKYHRTTATYLNTLLQTGFRVTGTSEIKPTPQMLDEHPNFADEIRRPIFLLLQAVKSVNNPIAKK